MVTVTLTGEPDQVHLEARQFFGIPVGQLTVNQVAALAQSDPKGLAEKIEEKKKTKATVESVAPAQITEQKPASPATGDLTEAVKIAVTRVGKYKGRQGAMDLLAKYGAKTGKEVPAARHAEFLAEANALIPVDQQVSA